MGSQIDSTNQLQRRYLAIVRYPIPGTATEHVWEVLYWTNEQGAVQNTGQFSDEQQVAL